MMILRGCFALALGTVLVFGCSKDSKETEESADESAEADEEQASEADGDDVETDDGDDTAAAKGKVASPLGALLRGSGESAAEGMGGTGPGIFGGGGPGGSPGAVAVGDSDTDEARAAAEAKMAKDKVAGPADPQCVELADHLMDIAMSEMAGQIPEDQKAMMEPMLAEAKREVVEQCAMFPKEMRACMLSAESVQGLETCATRMMGSVGGGGGDWDEDEVVDTDPTAEPVGPPPTWDGKDASCQAVGQHVLALAKHMMSGDPESAEMLDQMGEMLVGQVIEQCEAGPWPEAARRCVLKAQSESDLDACEDAIPGGL